LQQKLKEDVTWTWTPNDLKTIRNLKSMCKSLHILNLPNERDDLVVQTDASNAHWSAILKIKEGEKL